MLLSLGARKHTINYRYFLFGVTFADGAFAFQVHNSKNNEIELNEMFVQSFTENFVNTKI